jgi:hypothetical protein
MLAPLVVKDRVALGGLGEEHRALALGLVWAGLPGHTLAEAGINDALRQQLAGAARCLGTDHVELRRWLCDSGWVQRDGWGRAYLRVAVHGLPAHLRTLGQALDEGFGTAGPAAWVEAHRAARAAARLARRQAHELGSAGARAA